MTPVFGQQLSVEELRQKLAEQDGRKPVWVPGVGAVVDVRNAGSIVEVDVLMGGDDPEDVAEPHE